MRKILRALRGGGHGRISANEYRANLAGINIFFGAVLGFVLAGIEKLNSFQFGFVLMMLAGVVVSIMYISASRHRFLYAVYSIAVALFTPNAIDFCLRTKDSNPDKVLPTLLAWTLITIAVEFWPRHANNESDET